MNANSHIPRTRHAIRALAVVLVVLASGAQAAAAGGEPQPDARIEKSSRTASYEVAYRSLPAVAAYARLNGLTGLSPASLRPLDAATVSAGTDDGVLTAAEYARAGNLTGLSPASLSPRAR